MLEALQHENRRKILKLLVEVGEPVSPVMASRAMRLSLRVTSNHFRFLQRRGLVRLTEQRPRRGFTESFYVPHPVVHSSPVIRAVLDVT